RTSLQMASQSRSRARAARTRCRARARSTCAAARRGRTRARRSIGARASTCGRTSATPPRPRASGRRQRRGRRRPRRAPALGGAGSGGRRAGGGAKPTAPRILLGHKWELDHDPTGWWMSEKLDGVRAYWDGEAFVSRLGNRFVAPDWFTADLPADTLDGELWV